MQPRRAEVRSPTSGARFVGRTRELAQAVAALTRPGSMLVVEGEPGIGKTRLLREALSAPAIAPLERLHMACPPLDEPFPFGPRRGRAAAAQHRGARADPARRCAAAALPRVVRAPPRAASAAR